MGELVLYACLTFFSVYGIFSFLFFLKDFFSEKKYLKGKCLYSLLFVGEDFCRAEEMIKALLFKLLKNDTGICDRKIVVVHEGSDPTHFESLKTAFQSEPGVIVLKGTKGLENLKKI